MPSRHQSRRRALQILYEWDMRGESIEDAIRHYFATLYSEENEERPASDEFLEALTRGTVAHIEAIDATIERCSENWRLERMSMVDRNILRLATFEMQQLGTPSPVVIDQAIELGRRFSSDASIPFINGVLDKLRRVHDHAKTSDHTKTSDNAKSGPRPSGNSAADQTAGGAADETD